MEFCEFVQSIKEGVEGRCGDKGEIIIHEIQGNNGTVQTKISIKKEGENRAASVSLNDYYKRCMEEGLTVNGAAEEIYKAVSICEIPIPPDFTMESFEKIKDKVVYRLVDYRRNRTLLDDIPYIPYCDLAVTFHVLLGTGKGGLMTALIHNHHMTEWKTDADTLYRLAGDNTPRLLPLFIGSIGEMIKEISREHMGDDYEEALFDGLLGKDRPPFLYVMTNQEGIHGAAAVLYSGALKDFAETRGSDLVILPSSVHEVLLVPYTDGMDFRELKEMVKEVNRMEVPKEEVLSDNIYRYSREMDKVSLAC